MSVELLVYIGAALMVLLAVLAYRYFRSTARYAREVRESYARQTQEARGPTSLDWTTSKPIESVIEHPKSPDPTDTAQRDASIAEQTRGTSQTVEDAEELEAPPEAPVRDSPEDPASSDQPSADSPTSGVVEPPAESPGEPGAAEKPLPEELESPASPAAPSSRDVDEAVKNIDEQLAALPTGIELMGLPTIDRRQVADRRQALQTDRARLIEQQKRGAHRRSRRRKDLNSKS